MSATSPRARPRRLIIHAGTHKTASTDIQCRLRRSASLLAEQGIVYSYPVVCKNGDYEIVQDLEINAFSRERMKTTEDELRSERAAVEDLLG